MDADSFRRAVKRLALVTAVLLILPWLGVALAALGASSAYFEPSLQERARMIGLSASQRFERAVGFGAPLRQLVGVDDYLDSVLGDNPDIAFLALVDAEGAPVSKRGVANLAWAKAPAQADAVAPVMVHDQLVGELYVGLAADALVKLRREALTRLGYALICAAALAFEATRFVLDRRLAAPARAAQALADGVVAQRFTQVAGWRGHDALAAYAVALSRAIRHVGRRYRELRTLVADLREAQLSPAATAGAESILTQAVGPRSFIDQPHETPTPTPPGFRRFAVFLVAALLGIATPFVQGMVALGPATAIIVVAPFLLMTAFAGRALDPLARRAGPRLTVLAGAVVAGTAFLLLGEFDGWWRPALVSAAVGLGVGALLHACGDIYGLSAAEDYGDGQRSLWTGALAGAAAGLAFTALIDGAGDPAAAQWVVGLGFFGVGALLAALSPEHPTSRRPEVWLNGVEVASLLARPRILLFASQVLAPLGAALWVFVAVAPGAGGVAASDTPPMMMLFAAAMGGLLAINLSRPLTRHGLVAAWALAATMLAGGATLFFTPFDGGWISLAFNAANGFFFAFGAPLQSRLRADLAQSERGRMGEKRVILFFRMTEGVSGAIGLAAALALASAMDVTAATRGFGLVLMVAAVAFVVGWLALPSRRRGDLDPEPLAAEGDGAP